MSPSASTTSAASPLPTDNRLLAALARVSPADSRWLARRLEPVSLQQGEVLSAAGARFDHAYFPDGAVVSVICRMHDGGAAEVGTVGQEGMVGTGVHVRGFATIHSTEVQVRGAARRVDAEAFAGAADRRPAIRRLLDAYTQAYLGEVAQTSACNRLHGIEQRCARWLAMTHDRVGRAAAFPLTQEYLSIMLGVRREGVSMAAGLLRERGLIRYGRGSITILDRAGLEAAACECYGVARRHFDRVIG